MEIVTVAQALELNGYKFAHRKVLSKLGHVAKIYMNGRGVEMILIMHGQDGTLGSTNVGALEFILEILNGAHSG